VQGGRGSTVEKHPTVRRVTGGRNVGDQLGDNSFRLADCVGLCRCCPLDTPRPCFTRRDCASVSDGEVGAGVGVPALAFAKSEIV
jgi:hypothetical protein